MFYSVLENKKVVYIFNSKKQLAAAAGWLKQLDAAVQHYSTNKGRKALKTEMQGYKILVAKTDSEFTWNCDFCLPYPEQSFILKKFIY